MSVKLMSLVWDKLPSSGSELLCMLALADFANDAGGSIHPSMKTLAEKIRVSESQARRILHKFISDGIVCVVGNHGGGAPGMTRHYQINVSVLKSMPDVSVTVGIDDTPLEAETGSMGARGSVDATGSTGASGTGSMDARDGSHGCAETGSTHDTQTTNRTTSKPPKDNKAISLPEWVDRQTFEDFAAMRKKIKKPMTDRAVELLIGKLQKMRDEGHDTKAVMEASIINCWQDVFYPKSRQAGQHRQSAMNTIGVDDRIPEGFSHGH